MTILKVEILGGPRNGNGFSRPIENELFPIFLEGFEVAASFFSDAPPKHRITITVGLKPDEATE